MNIFVGCSSRQSHDIRYTRIAKKLGEFIAEKKHTLVFGGCKTGLMGCVYETIPNKSNHVISVSVKAYAKDLEDICCQTPPYIFDTINQRKQCIFEISDALVFLPGGIGTFDEILSAIESKRAHEHSLPILIVNANGYFNSLINMLNRAYSEGFAMPQHNLYTAVGILEALTTLEKLSKHIIKKGD